YGGRRHHLGGFPAGAGRDPDPRGLLHRHQHPGRRALRHARPADRPPMTAVAESSAAAPAVAQAPKANSPWRRLLRDKPARLAARFFLRVVSAAIFAPLLAPSGPYVNNMRLRLKPPGGEFLLGTDSQGRSMVTRLLFGLRATLMIGLS